MSGSEIALHLCTTNMGDSVTQKEQHKKEGLQKEKCRKGKRQEELHALLCDECCDHCESGWSGENELYFSLRWKGTYCAQCVGSLTLGDIYVDGGSTPLLAFKEEAISDMYRLAGGH